MHFPKSFPKSVTISLEGNSTAYGYSISITGCYAVLSATGHAPSLLSLFAAAAGAAAGFIVLELSMFAFREQLGKSDTEKTKLLARMTNIVSIGAAMGGAALSGLFLPGVAAWFVGGFASTILFIFFNALELSLAN